MSPVARAAALARAAPRRAPVSRAISSSASEGRANRSHQAIDSGGSSATGTMTEIMASRDASIGAMKIAMPAAVLAGGASRRMGRPKAALAYGASTLLEFQTTRLSALFEEVLVVAKEPPDYAAGPARVVVDGVAEHAAIHGLVRALEEAEDRIFVLAVDLPAVPPALLRAIA